ncbi:MAG: hypothetical protein NDI61_07300 [Bdellovibrionaceae bacterium]|nr:hypothetical protein [Pseudobdellovibrionaceae bacterium]
MFLMRMRILALCTLLLGSVSAFAEAPIAHLESGRYERTRGEPHLCLAFRLSAGQAKRSRVELGPLYSFSTKKSVHREPSDLHRNCEFIETNSREDYADKTVLTKNNVELCDGKAKSDITIRLTIRSDHLNLDLEDEFGPEYSCAWTKANDIRENAN